NGVTIQPYDSIYAFADALSARSVGKVLMNAKTVNYRLYEAIAKGSEIIDEVNPSQFMKACKNATEVQNIRNAHIKDGVALVKWLKWLKENVGTEPMTEISISDKLAECRAAQENFIDLSFDTICGYEAHGAIIHYSATQESNVPVEAKGLLLVDSGGHYLEGSTDITRTIVLGPVTEEQKKMFTLVLKGHFALASARFPRGVTGMNLDVLAKKPLWDLGLDYRHGTGHGVGYLLNIHEGPNSFRWKLLPNAEPAVLTEGMITSDEPGYYEDGVFGIRHEDELLVVSAEETDYGEFLQFENLTYCPFDLEGIDASLLDASEKKAINAYHEHIYRTLAPFLTREEQLWLRYETREI
ncbi:MAG: aminopeptidase P family protein, partial [Lachnospiraceae bacterium]|nr:aminopeptidase P family protein [Lachnospiraceae bacterium]